MVSVLSPLTLHLAVALGVYAFAASFGLLIAPAERSARLFEELTGSPGLILAYGVIAFAVGAAWVMVHHEWITPLGTIISLAGWIIAIEGVLMLALPNVMIALSRACQRLIKPLAIVGIVLGALLILAGLTGRADAPIL